VVGGILENTNAFVFQEDLTLRTGTSSLGIWVSLSKFITSFDIDVSTLGDGTEERVRGLVEREDGMP